MEVINIEDKKENPVSTKNKKMNRNEFSNSTTVPRLWPDYKYFRFIVANKCLFKL